MYMCRLFMLLSDKTRYGHDPTFPPSRHECSQTKFCGVEWLRGSGPVQAGLSLLHPLDKTLPKTVCVHTVHII